MKPKLEGLLPLELGFVEKHKQHFIDNSNLWNRKSNHRLGFVGDWHQEILQLRKREEMFSVDRTHRRPTQMKWQLTVDQKSTPLHRILKMGSASSKFEQQG